MHNRPQPMRAWAWGLLLVLALIWGSSFFFIEIALADLRPFSIVLGRVAIAALVLHGVVLASGQRMPTAPALWGRFAVMGLLTNLVPFSLIAWGQTQIASGLAAILNATAPIWVVLLAHVLTRDERLSPNRAAGVLCGFGGVVVVIGPDALSGLGSNVLAQFAVVGATLCYALAAIYGKRFAGLPPLITATGQITCTTVLLLPVALVADRFWLLPLPAATTWAALLALALLNTALAFLIYFRLLAAVGATNLLLVTLLIPVTALLLGITLLGEVFDVRHVGGMGLIAAGLVAIDGRVLAWLWAILERPMRPLT